MHERKTHATLSSELHPSRWQYHGMVLYGTKRYSMAWDDTVRYFVVRVDTLLCGTELFSTILPGHLVPRGTERCGMEPHDMVRYCAVRYCEVWDDTVLRYAVAQNDRVVWYRMVPLVPLAIKDARQTAHLHTKTSQSSYGILFQKEASTLAPQKTGLLAYLHAAATARRHKKTRRFRWASKMLRDRGVDILDSVSYTKSSTLRSKEALTRPKRPPF